MYYRKYRPQTIAELDNEQVRETLGWALLDNKWVHAYLLIGTRGSGKTSTARLIAKIVNCTNRKKGEEPCNKCDSCKAITGGYSLDVIEIDAASNTGVDDIRDLREKAKLAPSGSKYKVYIIDEVHMLSTGAFSALLKTLEEPPEHVIFVLATTDPQKLPETIVSRCLVYDFGRINESEIVRSLRKVVTGEKLDVSDGDLLKIAKLSSGSYRDAQKILEQLAMKSAKLDLEHIDGLNTILNEKISKKLLEGLIAGKKTEVISEIEQLMASGIKIKELIGGMILNCRDILLLRNGIKQDVEDLRITDEEINSLISKLVEANGMVRDCPVPQLPLELVVLEYGGNGEPKTEMVAKTREEAAWWPQVLSAVKPYNHSIEALLKACRPKGAGEEFVTIEVFYKFHKEKLEEKKNREILEKVISDIMGRDLKVKFVLGEKGG